MLSHNVFGLARFLQWIIGSAACHLLSLEGKYPRFYFLRVPLFLWHLRSLGAMCIIIALDVKNLNHKLSSVFLGYLRVQKDYRCSSPTLRWYFTSADVSFDESSSFFRGPSETLNLVPTPLVSLDSPKYTIHVHAPKPSTPTMPTDTRYTNVYVRQCHRQVTDP